MARLNSRHFHAFATADEADTTQLAKQIEKFERLVDELSVKPAHVHYSNSAYALWHGAGDSAIVRYGIGIYGINPSNGDLALKDEAALTPALRWETEMVKVKKLEAGDTVSVRCDLYSRGRAMGSDTSSWLCGWIYPCLQ